MIISLSAPKRSGKDVVANILKKSFNYQRVAFADPLRRICAYTFELPEELFFDDALKDITFANSVVLTISNIERLIERTGANEIQAQMLYQLGRDKAFKTPREILQYVGTELIRDCLGDNFLINIAISEISKMEGNIIVTDARFPNERVILKNMGATLVRLKRPGFDGDGHSSEQLFGDDTEYDVVINNSGTISELEHDIVMWHTLRFSK